VINARRKAGEEPSAPSDEERRHQELLDAIRSLRETG
jgi:hypothetical protein